MIGAFLAGVSLGTLAVAFYGANYIASKLAEYEDGEGLFWITSDPPRTVKALLYNGEYFKLVCSDPDVKFATQSDVGQEVQTIENGRNTRKRIEAEGEVIFTKKRPRFLRPFGGIRWKGLPQLSQVYKYDQKWAMLEQERSSTGEVRSVPRYHEEKNLKHIFIRAYPYYFLVEGAENADNIPVNVQVIATISIVNPRLALFAVHRWLETVQTQLISQLRPVIGTLSYDELRAIAGDSKSDRAGGGINLLDDPNNPDPRFPELMSRIKEFRTKYGVRVEALQFFTVEPATADARRFVEASTQVYVAAQSADAAKEKAREILTLAKARQDEIAMTYGEAAKYPEIAGVFAIAEAVRIAKPTTVVFPGGITPAIAVGTSLPPPEEKKST